MSTDPLRGVVMAGIRADGSVIAKLYESPTVAQEASAVAAASGKYEAVLLAKPYQVRRRPNALP
jgi:hypothetical protein